MMLVVGAGPTGLVMAHELARHGVECRLIEKARERPGTSRAIAILPRTMEVFDLMRLADDFLAAGRRIPALNFFSDDERIVRIALDRLDSPYPFALGLPQDQTERILEEHLTRQGVSVERPAEIMALSQNQEGVSARVRFDGTGTEEIRCDYLLGCDGARSTVRHLLGMPFRGGRYKESVLLADVGIEGYIEKHEAQGFMHPNGLTLCFPLPEGRYRLVAPDPPPHWGIEPTLEQCQSLINGRGLGHLRLTDARWTSTFQISHRQVDHFRSGRVFLAGDAAHIHSPLGAQGMNAGIQDAFNLAWKLALVSSRAARFDLLDTYETERKPIDARIIRWTDRGTRLLLWRGPNAHTVLRQTLAFLASFDFIRRGIVRAASQIDATYRDSPIIEEHSLKGGPQAGDRAPDATIRSTTGASLRLFDLFAEGRHTLLLLWPAIYEPLGLREDLCAVHRIADVDSRSGDFVDVNGGVAQHYGHFPSAYLIRPDGHIAFRSGLADSPQLLSTYLGRFFATEADMQRRVA